MKTKSDTLKKIENFRKKRLVDLYNQCTPEQQNVFNRMYVSITEIPDEKIDWAMQQCERTIAENKIKMGEKIMDKKFREMFDTIRDLLSDINVRAIKEEDKEAKSLSCNLIEIIDSHG